MIAFVLHMTTLVGPKDDKINPHISPSIGQSASPSPESQALPFLPLATASKPRIYDKGRWE